MNLSGPVAVNEKQHCTGAASVSNIDVLNFYNIYRKNVNKRVCYFFKIYYFS